MFGSKNTLKYICLIVLLLFTVGYFVSANNISYAFAFDESQELYNNKMELIKSLAEIYGQKNENIFEEKDVTYITVQDLVDDELLSPDRNGEVLDPTSEVKTLNEMKIRLANKNGKIVAKLLINKEM